MPGDVDAGAGTAGDQLVRQAAQRNVRRPNRRPAPEPRGQRPESSVEQLRPLGGVVLDGIPSNGRQVDAPPLRPAAAGRRQRPPPREEQGGRRAARPRRGAAGCPPPPAGPPEEPADMTARDDLDARGTPPARSGAAPPGPTRRGRAVKTFQSDPDLAISGGGAMEHLGETVYAEFQSDPDLVISGGSKGGEATPRRHRVSIRPGFGDLWRLITDQAGALVRSFQSDPDLVISGGAVRTVHRLSCAFARSNQDLIS